MIISELAKSSVKKPWTVISCFLLGSYRGYHTRNITLYLQRVRIGAMELPSENVR